MSPDLHQRDTSLAFYDARFTGHYMAEWTPEAKDRIAEAIRALNLPQTGEALDFGAATA